MTDYLALLLEEQREEERERAETGTWETGAVRVPRLRREEETEEKWGSSGEAVLSQTARQTVRAETETEAAASGMERSDGPDWSARRWVAGETETVQAGLRITEQAESLPLARQAEEPVLSAGAAGAIGAEWESAPGTAANGAGWLDRAVRISLEGLPAPDRESRVVTLEPAEWNGGAGRLELRQLDRLVRRDARRFDGGFQLL